MYDNVTMIDVAGPADLFSHANDFGANYETVLISSDGNRVKASNGLTLFAEQSAAQVGRLDTVIVPGAYGMISKPFDTDLIESVLTLTGGSERIASVCTGSFILAQVGLLDYRSATTHWRRVEQFAKSFPLVKVDPDSLFVRDGNIITSAGVSSGIDLALALVEDDLGPGWHGRWLGKWSCFCSAREDNPSFPRRLVITSQQTIRCAYSWTRSPKPPSAVNSAVPRRCVGCSRRVLVRAQLCTWRA